MVLSVHSGLFYCLIIGVFNLRASEIKVASGEDINTDISSAISGDIILLEGGGLYEPGQIDITGGKRITLKVEEGVGTMPEIYGHLRFDANRSTIMAEGVEFISNGENYFIRTNSGDSISLISFKDCEIHGFGRTIIRASEDINKIDSIIYDGTHFYNFDGSGYQLHYMKNTNVSYFKMVNSTFNGLG